MSDTKLKPCPFCGGEAELLYRKGCADRIFYRVECEECDCRTASYEDELQATEAWNNRKPMERIEKKIEEIMQDDKIRFADQTERWR